MPDNATRAPVQVVILPEFLDAFARSPAVIQADLLAFFSRFRENPLDPGRPGTASDKAPASFRIYEVNAAWSVVAAFPDEGLAVLMNAGWSKAAREWAASHRLEADDAANGLRHYRLKALPKPAPEEAPPAAPLFAEIADDELLAVGLSRADLPLVRGIRSKLELEAARGAIPPEAYESLAWHASGAEWSAVKRELAKRHATADSQMGKIRLYLNPEQEKIVRGPWTHAVLVQGGAGTGKSVVALHRAKHLAELPDWAEGDRLLFVTATRNLAVDIEQQLRRLVRSDRMKSIEVTSLDGWVTAFLRRNGYRPAIIYPGKPLYETAWKAAAAHLPEHFPEAEARSELEENILPGNIRLLKAYLKPEASALPEATRKALWPAFEAFRKELFARGKVAAPDAFHAAIGLLAEGAGEGPAPYRAVIADEIQEFGPEALKLLRSLAPDHDKDPALANSEGDLFLVGDLREQIYGEEVSFMSCGINIKGRRTKRLSVSYRTTAEIAAAAQTILSGGAPADPETAPGLRHGPLPALYAGHEFDDEVSWIVRQIHALLAEEKDLALSSIVIAARTDSLLDDYQKALAKRGIRTLQISRNIPDDPNAAGVRCATMHRLKGLEFRAVFIAGADDGAIPDAEALNAPAERGGRAAADRAERTLFHVAASRAVDRLYVSCSDTPGEYLQELFECEKRLQGPQPA